MPFNVRPVASALARNRTGAILVALEIAIALAVMVNAAWIVAQRIHDIAKPTGIDQSNIFALAIAGFTSDFDLGSSEHADLAYLRSLPGVIAATTTSAVPLTDIGQGNGIWRQPGERGTEFDVRSVQVDTEALKTLGVHIVAGRDFTATELLPYTSNQSPSEVLVTQSFARKLFPNATAVGKAIYGSSGSPLTIVGVTSDFIGSVMGPPSYDQVVYAQQPGGYGMYFCLVRTRPGKAAALMQIAERHLAADNPNRVIFEARTLAYYKQRLDAENRNMAIFLTTVTALILAVTCLGIFGLTTFNVSTRTKQIGTMRAVGARKSDVIAWFLTENAFILSAGLLLGCILALAAGAWLSSAYALPRLDPTYLALGVVILAAIGQLAAWHPARRAAAVSPAVATQTI
ncbi:MAG: FtsX-like permease family protein [Steroidobacteraceae bacterium]